jgi:hypothetical protein
MKRQWFCALVFPLTLPALCLSQPAPTGKDMSSSTANAQAAAKEVVADLREARQLLKQINDRKTRDRLELLLTRAERRTADLQKSLAILAGPHKPRPISAEEFAKFLQGVKGNTFDKDKVPFIENFAKNRNLSCEQVREILKTFSFDDGRGQAAVLLYPRVTDPENFFLALEVFTFDSGRKAVREKLKLK